MSSQTMRVRTRLCARKKIEILDLHTDDKHKLDMGIDIKSDCGGAHSFLC